MDDFSIPNLGNLDQDLKNLDKPKRKDKKGARKKTDTDDQIASIFGYSIKKKTEKPAKKKPNPLAGATCFCVFVLLLFVVIAIILTLKGMSGHALVVIGVDGILFYNWIHELKTPNHGLVFRRGEVIGEVGPGWHLVDGFLNKIKIYSKGLQRIDLPETMMYKKDGTPILMKKVSFFYQLTNLLKVVLMDEDPKERITSVGMAKLKASIGKRNFTGSQNALVAEQDQIETEMMGVLKKEMNKWGVKITDVEVADYEETIHSRAEEKKVLGTASAEAQGKIATAIAEPLKDNLPAAIASVGNSLAEPLVKAFMPKKKSKKKET